MTQGLPRFSIVAPAYKTAAYLPRFIASVTSQDFESWELVVVDDGSPDATADILREAAAGDARIVPVIPGENHGTHMARKLGVAASRGEYVILFDSDDELVSGSLRLLDEELSRRPVDILHFGTELSGTGTLDEQGRSALLALCNRELGDLVGPEDILRSSFDFGDDGFQRQDWGILRRACRGELMRRAFARMADERLVYGEDAYELIVVASLAHDEHVRNDIVVYRYCLGRGITVPRGSLSEGRFRSRVEDFERLLGACRAYADGFAAFDLLPCVDALKKYHLMTLMNEWRAVGPEDVRERLAKEMTRVVGASMVASELCRLARDAAYADWDCGRAFDEAAPYLRWLRIAEGLVGGVPEAALPTAYGEYHAAALRHIEDLRGRAASDDGEPADPRGSTGLAPCAGAASLSGGFASAIMRGLRNLSVRRRR